MKTWRMAGLALAALAAACSRPAEPFVVPEPQDVSYVSASQLEGTSKVWEHELRDPKRIESVLAHLRQHNSGYTTAQPDGEQDHAIALGTDESVPLIIWIGPDWLGGFDLATDKDGRTISRYRPMDASEREALLALIREPDPKGRGRISNGQYR